MFISSSNVQVMCKAYRVLGGIEVHKVITGAMVFRQLA